MSKKVFAFMLCCLLALAGTGCATGSFNSSESESTATEIVISEFRNVNWAPVYLAEANGYFEEEGLTVTWARYNDGPIAFQGLHVNDSQFCLLSQEPVLKAQLEGIESTLIYTIMDTRLYSLISRPEIKTVQDLKGSVIFAGMPGSAPYSFVSSILTENGIDPEKDVTFINMDYGASLAALEAGQIQASFIGTDNRLELRNMNANILADTANPADAEKYLKSAVFPGEIICTTKKYCEENPDTVQAFVNAVSKGVAWFREHASAESAELLAPYFKGMDLNTLTEKLDIVKESSTKTGYIGESPEIAVQDFCIANGVIAEHIPYDELVNMTFVENYQQRK